MQLRDYQREAVDKVKSVLVDQSSTVIVLPTGLGKTVIYAHAVQEIALETREMRAIVLAHREELIVQGANKLRAITGLDPDIEMADSYSFEDGLQKNRVIVSSIQTQISGRGERKRMHRFNTSHPWFVVVDEAHHAVSASYRAVIDHYMKHPQSRLLGVTATPDRLDERALGQVFASCAYEYDTARAIREGWLVPIRQRFVQCASLDLSGCRVSGGDLQLNDLEIALEKSLQEMVLPMVDIVGNRRTLVFAATVHHAERVCEILNRPGVSKGTAVIVHGGTDRELRRQLFREFGDGKHQFLVNVAVATEGWDDPATDAQGVQVVAMMRPTQSRAVYQQAIGRGTRSLPGTVDGHENSAQRRAAIAASAKTALLVLDFRGNAGRHSLVHAGDVLGGRMDALERFKRNTQTAKGGGKEFDVLTELDFAELEERKHAESRVRAHVVGRAEYVSQEIDPFLQLEIQPRRVPNWERKHAASLAQRSLLERNGVRFHKDLNMGQARQLIDALMSKPSEKQGWVLKQAGINPTGIDRKNASLIIDAIKKGDHAGAKLLASAVRDMAGNSR